MPNDIHFMRRCLDLALLGAGQVSPNPMVGAVVVHDGRIIGEGWHQRYGEAHAEVNAFNSILAADRALLPESTLYCSLEPCFHHGKTPPCVDRVLHERVRRVVVAGEDPNPRVAGQSLRRMAEAGVEVQSGVLRDEAWQLNRAFFTWITERRPYVVVKWAQSCDGFLGKPGERTSISSPAALRLVHRWRAACDAILVGTNTALTDNPRLDTRLYVGNSPLRIAIDRRGQLPETHHLLGDRQDTWILGPARTGNWQRTDFLPMELAVDPEDLLQRLHAAQKAILLVEGGATVLRQWLEAGCWDEVRVLENNRYLYCGLRAPELPASAQLEEEWLVADDRVRVFTRSGG